MPRVPVFLHLLLPEKSILIQRPGMGRKGGKGMKEGNEGQPMPGHASQPMPPFILFPRVQKCLPFPYAYVNTKGNTNNKLAREKEMLKRERET